MKGFVCTALLLTLVLVVPVVMSARHIARPHSHHGHHHATLPITGEGEKVKPNFYGERRPLMKHRRPDPLQIAGSTLPNCSHACGSCSPCRLVMVSFVCASLAEAETCPMAYKCMCNNKSYPVP
ncbi:protein EPIDERMAL PATTERNING FACTOR 1-like [Actinidia eriantha]|uniref:Epidermal patterning factor-like protein n=1 Tax=Actinidia rufa TaxID=165716 RepID=A0A7J0DDH9_9ERIC|nr:protein EPIDERMAL PATTERNING FACTOR 1-like [Actinidia eriantha]XP_057488291.1 protein EPIDERMAL PATTERNING FACTOR 1-like [Actinidia eriantha]GFS31808.1 epidermal patterning factor 1 [Actinidia rufa]